MSRAHNNLYMKVYFQNLQRQFWLHVYAKKERKEKETKKIVISFLKLHGMTSSDQK